jgi:hypothetical protein
MPVRIDATRDLASATFLTSSVRCRARTVPGCL